MKIKVTLQKRRNPFVPAMRFRLAGRHRRGASARRGCGKRELRRELSLVGKVRDYRATWPCRH